MTEPLHKRFRPKSLDDVAGQDAATRALDRVLRQGGSRAFLFVGPSGVGKTTLARIIGYRVGAPPGGNNFTEVDAATHSGVDDARQIQEHARYKPINGKSKVVVLDECHQLSRQAWNAMLKNLEEPPDWLYWVLCTTEPSKVPRTIQTRCVELVLDLVDDDELRDLLDEVAARAEIRVDDEVLDACVRAAGGSPRQALVNLEKCRHVEDAREADDLLKTAHAESAEVVDLCRSIMANEGYDGGRKLVSKLNGTNPESVRIVVCAYFQKVALSGGAKADRAVDVLRCFGTPYPAGTSHIYPVLLDLEDLYRG